MKEFENKIIKRFISRTSQTCIRMYNDILIEAKKMSFSTPLQSEHSRMQKDSLKSILMRRLKELSKNDVR